MSTTIADLDTALRNKAVGALRARVKSDIARLTSAGYPLNANSRLKLSAGKTVTIGEVLEMLEDDIVNAGAAAACEKEVEGFLARVEFAKIKP